MDWQDDTGARRDGPLDSAVVDIEGHRVDVDKDRIGAEVSDHPGRRGEGVGRGDDLVAGADSDRFERQVQTSRGRVDGERLDGRRGACRRPTIR